MLRRFAAPTPDEIPESISPRDRPLQELCRRALNSVGLDWDNGSDWANDVAEAERRNLGIDDCRVAIGLPKLGPASPPVRSEPVPPPQRVLCARALNAAEEDWDKGSVWTKDVAEAKRLNLSIDDCRVAIGLPRLERTPPPELRGALCARALNDFGMDWDKGSVWTKDVAEAKRLNLSIDDCRVAIGLPKLEDTVPPPATSKPIPAPVEQSSPAPGGGAKIEAQTVTEDGQELTFISIEGELALGDERRFADAAIRFSSAVVVLSSPGGNLYTGIEIGNAIRLKGFATLVPEGFQCASACALAWLGGSPRFMGAGSTVGFHAASSTEFGGPSSMGNAAIGADLNQLNLPLKAILYSPSRSRIKFAGLPSMMRRNMGLKYAGSHLVEVHARRAAA